MFQPIQGAAGVVIPFHQARNAAAPRKADPHAPSKPSITHLMQMNQYQMINLQRDNPDRDRFLFRDKKDLHWHFNDHAGTGFGAYKNGKLVAMILLHENNDLPPVVRRDLDPAAQDGKHGLIGGAVVATEFRGMGLCRDMIESCIKEAQARRMDHLHARIRVGNESSLKAFQKAGFSVLPHTGPSPDDPKHDVHYLYLDMKAHQRAREATPACQIHEFDR